VSDTKEKSQANSHRWRIESYVRYVSRGTCECGAVRFFADVIDKEALKLAEHYNKSEGKEGQGHMVIAKAIKEKNPGVGKEDSDPLPVPPRPRGREQLRLYFEENKEAILQDYQSLKLKGFYAKWHMTSTTWTKLKRDWKLLGKSPRKSTLQKETTKPRRHKGPPSIEMVNRALKEQGTNHLPAFPEFNDSWPFPVQEKWFEVYLGLRKLELEKKQ